MNDRLAKARAVKAEMSSNGTKISKDCIPDKPFDKEGLPDRVKERLKDIRKNSPTMLSVFERAYVGKSRSAAIKAKCLDCCCYQRNEVKLCTTVACPLWNYRPFQGKA